MHGLGHKEVEVVNQSNNYRSSFINLPRKTSHDHIVLSAPCDVISSSPPSRLHSLHQSNMGNQASSAAAAFNAKKGANNAVSSVSDTFKGVGASVSRSMSTKDKKQQRDKEFAQRESDRADRKKKLMEQRAAASKR